MSAGVQRPSVGAMWAGQPYPRYNSQMQAGSSDTPRPATDDVAGPRSSAPATGVAMDRPATRATLDYAPATRRSRWRHARRATLCLGLVALGASAYLWAPDAWRRIQILHYQRKCLRYIERPDFVTYEPDAERAAVLLNQGSRYWGKEYDPKVAHADEPDCLQRLNRLLPPPGASTGAGVSFMHQRRSKSGERRLVIVPAQLNPQFCMYELLEPTTLTGKVQTAQSYLTVFENSPTFLGPGQDSLPMRVFAGQPDPLDESHFTFAYEYDSQQGIIDAWLKDTQTVKFQVRSGPLTRPVTSPVRMPRLPRRPIDPNDYRFTPRGMDLIDDRSR